MEKIPPEIWSLELEHLDFATSLLSVGLVCPCVASLLLPWLQKQSSAPLQEIRSAYLENLIVLVSRVRTTIDRHVEQVEAYPSYPAPLDWSNLILPKKLVGIRKVMWRSSL